ncbi:putative plastid-lipid-associated protein 4, chloroplastic [Gracilariopsis chorda]|uniref:Putative plastid-lipid-associated protein 4, chloroplastic n=1 Tax=Gracilariopsis chorda TaxID=448386 RepID=A0A2V3IXK8_9FLOR|nr:putative plastid-lipid-associated protein 4, chloroplastic [Gracilariopsis chorda]|eukprot:PXF46878.1 putative plastid-lipid-associated protein 4, chloroplastic [Gracilariopsis chorda]
MAFVSAFPPSSLSSAHGRLPGISATRPPCLATGQARMSVTAPNTFKQALLEKVHPLNFGRDVADNPAEQLDIEQLARQVEATNKSLSPGTDPNLSGVWDMVYTTSKSILATGSPGFLQSRRIVQEINAAVLKGRNSETFRFGPLQFDNAVNFELNPASEKRFDVNFVEFVLLNFIRVNVRENMRFTGWLEVTYLDEDLRISRGNAGNLFILIKK